MTSTPSRNYSGWADDTSGVDHIDECPYCGKKARVLHIEGHYSIPGEYVVSCPTGYDASMDYGSCPGYRSSYDRHQPGARPSYKEAVEAWNWKHKEHENGKDA